METTTLQVWHIYDKLVQNTIKDEKGLSQLLKKERGYIDPICSQILQERSKCSKLRVSEWTYFAAVSQMYMILERAELITTVAFA